MSRVFHPVKTKFLHATRAPRRNPARRRRLHVVESALSTHAAPAKLIAHPVDRLQGRVRAPGDKSVSHRSLMFGALALGRNQDHRPAGQARTCSRTAAALRALGAQVEHEGGGAWRVRGFGVGGRTRAGQCARPRQFGHLGPPSRPASWPATASPASGPAMPRCAAGRCSGSSSRCRTWARASRRARAAACRSPSSATDEMVPIEYRLPVASARVKSCHPAGGPEYCGRDDRDRARGDARPYRAHAAPFRRRGAGRAGRRRRQAHHRGRLARAQGARHRGAGRSLVGRPSRS